MNEVIFEVFYEQPIGIDSGSQRRLSIFNDKVHIVYLLNFIRHEFNERKVIGLPESQFNRAKELFRSVLGYMDENQQEIEIKVLLQCIKIVCRVYKKTSKKQTMYLANVLNDLAIWNNYQLWNKIYEHILQEKSGQSIENRNGKMAKIRSLKNLFSLVTRQPVQQRTEVEVSEDTHKNILREINYFMI